MMNMEPIVAPLMSEICLTLGDFVGMMWKNIIYAAAVDVHIFAEVLHTDA